MSGRAIEQHDKPAVQHVESHQTSPVHEQVQSLQRSAALEKSPSSQAPQPKELDLKAPIAGAGSEFNATPATRGLARDGASADATKVPEKSANGSSDASPRAEVSSPGRVAVDSADVPQTSNAKPNERPTNASTDGTPTTGSKVPEKAGGNGSTDATPSSGKSISTMNENFVKQNPDTKFQLPKENGGVNDINDGGAAKPSKFEPPKENGGTSQLNDDGTAKPVKFGGSQLQLNLNPNNKPDSTKPESQNQNSPDGVKPAASFTLYPPTPGSESKSGADKFGDSKSNPSDFPQNSPFYTYNPPTGSSPFKAGADKLGDSKSQVPTGLSDAALTPEQKATAFASPSQQRAEADRLLQKQPGNSPEQNAQIDINRGLVHQFDEGVHRGTLIKNAGQGKFGEDGGKTIAEMTESKDFRIEARKIVKD